MLNKEKIQKLRLLAIFFLSYLLVMSLYVDTLGTFLDKFGARFLPFVLISRAIFICFYSIIITAFSAKYSMRKMFLALLIIFTILFGLLPLSGSWGDWRTVFFFFCTAALFLALDVSILGYGNSFMDPVQAKNFMPKLYAAGDFALILGSFLGAYLKFINGSYLETFIPVTILAIVVLIVKFGPNEKSPIPEPYLAKQPIAKEQKLNPLEQIKSAFNYVFFKSRLFRTMMFSIFLLVGLQIFIDYKLSSTVAAIFKQDDLTLLLAQIYFVESSIRFFWNIGFSKKVLFGVGAMNSIIAYPIMIIAALILGIFLNFNLVFAIILYLISAIYYFSTVQVANSQIISAAPKKMSESAYYLLAQWAVGFSSIIFSAFLFLYYWFPDMEKTLNTALIGLFTISLIASLFKLKKYYIEHLKNHLASKDISDKMNALDLLAEKNQKNKGEFLLINLLDSEKNETIKTRVIHNLGLIGNVESIVHLIKTVENGNIKNQFAAIQAIDKLILNRKNLNRYPLTKHLILQKYEHLFITQAPHFLKLEILHGLKNFNLDDIMGFLERSLKDTDPQIVSNAIEVLSTFNDRAIIYYLKPFLANKDPYLYCAALVGLWKYKDLRVELLPILIKVLKSDEKRMIEAGLFIINAANLYWEKRYVVENLNHKDEKIKTFALITMVNLGSLEYIDKFINKMLKLNDDNNSEMLEFVLSRYRRFNKKMKKIIIQKILQMESSKIALISKIFHDSQYVFEEELSQME